ncbi:Fur family transcriptional regulator [Crateriforma conspicua]|uniref:Peroxide-responsive repressor PerR n=1 Tax=Crateriforma conspicua TaxID=2527996 RepID=A0A5C6FKI3_9PLAN|nr:transcriptional repressor [Crateriforma conspicua]TWU62497.1 Peroxide-responsive repressor PerR [Crateriforma conspicua]
MGTSSAKAKSIQDDIRAAGLRATPSRVATLRMLRQAIFPMTHADVADELDEAGFDRATIFRNLIDLTDVGLLRRTELGDHVYRFERVRPGETATDSHPHFLCTACGTVSCLANVQLTTSSLRESDKVGEVAEILLRGICNDCK